MPTTVIDNDILHKGAGYGLLTDFLTAIPAKPHEIGILGAAKYVVAHHLRRAKLDDAAHYFEILINDMHQLEPTKEESTFAAQLEFKAQALNLNVDSGESLLCAIVVTRMIRRLVTGDKRALYGFATLSKSFDELDTLKGKIICLEQILIRLLEHNADQIRNAICAQPKLDRALTLCFSCSNPDIDPKNWTEGLSSYLRHIHDESPSILNPLY